MEPTRPQRYLEGFSAGMLARARRQVNDPPTAEPLTRGIEPPRAPDPWRVLLNCAEEDRPPRAGERGALTALGVVDLAPEGRDGCRIRLRGMPGGRLGAWQLRELAAVCQGAAGGFVELGARGGPELAVVGWREAVGTLARLRAAGFAGGDGGVRCSPMAGIDPEEMMDVTDLARTLDAALGTEGPSVGLDGGGRGWQESPADDLTLRATGADVFWGTTTTAGEVVRFGAPVARAASAVLALTEIWQANGSSWEGLDPGKVREALETTLGGALPDVVTPAERELPWGIVAQKQPGLCALVAAGPADGRWRSRALLALAAFTEETGVGEARLWPGGVLVPGVAAGRAAEDGLSRLADIVALVR